MRLIDADKLLNLIDDFTINECSNCKEKICDFTTCIGNLVIEQATAYDTEQANEHIYKFLGEFFDAPCNYGYDGIDMARFMDEKFCEENCDTDYAKCWKKFFEQLKEGGGVND